MTTHQPPKPLPHEPLPHPPKPPHKKRSPKTLLIGFLTGTVLTALIGLILWMLEISINVILPVLAPIWVGSVSLVYSVFREK